VQPFADLFDVHGSFYAARLPGRQVDGREDGSLQWRSRTGRKCVYLCDEAGARFGKLRAKSATFWSVGLSIVGTDPFGLYSELAHDGLPITCLGSGSIWRHYRGRRVEMRNK
jgi:hypothetical protein